MKGVLSYNDARHLLDSLQTTDLKQISFLCKLYKKIHSMTFFSETKFT